MKHSKFFIIGILCLCAAAAAGIALWRMNPAQPAKQSFQPDLDPNAGTIQEEEPEQTEPDSILIPGYPSVTMEADNSSVSINLMNPEGNPCYFVFELILTETGESLYKSGMVEPGKAISDITLAHGLAEGEHPVTIQITTFSLKDGTPMNGANVETIFIAKK